MVKSLNDKDLIAQIQSSDELENDRALTYLYKENYQLIAAYVQKNSGAEPDAEDVFQDSLIVLYKQIKLGNFRLESSLSTYLYAIARNIWLKKLRKTGRESALKETHHAIPDSETHLDILESSEKSNLIAQLLDRLDEKCKKLLLLYYYEKLRMKAIAEKMNWQSEQVAKNQKAKCMKKMREMVGNHPNLKFELK